MKALILDPKARQVHLRHIPQPSPGPDEILVEVEAIALNPIDPLYVSHPLAESDRTIGSDFAGTVSSLGSYASTVSNLKIGDRVSGFLQGACSVNDRPGAFAEFLVVPWDLVWRIPENVKVEEAAGVSLVALTAAQAIWYRLGLAAPFEYDRELVVKENPAWAEYQNAEANGGSGQVNFFIYGASTAVGLYAAQMIRLSAEASGKSVRLFGAASKARWPMLKSEPYSYDHLVDYRDDDWPEQITKLANGGGMHYVYDCISEGTSVQRSLSTLSPNGRAAIVRSREGGAWSATAELPTEPIYGGVWEGLGEEVQYTGFTIKKSVAARHFAVEFYKWLSGVVGSKLMPVPIRSMPGGLERVVQDGFQLLGASTMNPREAISRDEEWMKPVSAEKLVYQM